mmetsp:Transcript_20240/g.63617  ORF Transcript_20240/g.63617 Transcript_20240/m.63617 type:complete len:95 (-) Transcript_20240:39-323(-)
MLSHISLSLWLVHTRFLEAPSSSRRPRLSLHPWSPIKLIPAVVGAPGTSCVPPTSYQCSSPNPVPRAREAPPKNARSSQAGRVRAAERPGTHSR